MKICVFGAGAIGGFVGAKLADAGAEVSMVARGAHLSAMKENGLTLIENGLKPKKIKIKVDADAISNPLAAEANVIANTTSDEDKGL